MIWPFNKKHPTQHELFWYYKGYGQAISDMRDKQHMENAMKRHLLSVRQIANINRQGEQYRQILAESTRKQQTSIARIEEQTATCNRPYKNMPPMLGQFLTDVDDPDNTTEMKAWSRMRGFVQEQIITRVSTI